ncbi:MAG: RluA family pseudouridine synthase [Planctomycetaceae bacterium]|nr:RluA family pseudouridine synthase [Planctomycetaceae bacterium]
MPRPSQSRPYHVGPTESGQTLVSLLRRWQAGLSWSEAKQLLKGRRVSVNGAMCLDEGRRVKAGDVVHLHAHAKTPQPTAADVQLLYWDQDVVVVAKPPLMTTLRHREERNWPAARKNLQPTLDECLPKLLLASEGGGPDEDSRRHKPPRGHRARGRGHPAPAFAHGPRRRKLPAVRAVHRLDRDTSGVMVFARNETAERDLVQQFKAHSIDRVYQAVVHGHPVAQTISRRLIRDRGDGLRGGTDSPIDGEDAVTHVRPLEDLGEYSLVECQLETGRTHQIRIHLSDAGHLVCGDPLYHRRLNAATIEDRSGAPRLSLHAARLAFDHPRTKERIDFQLELPEDLERFVRSLVRRGRRRKHVPTDESE